MDTLQALQWRYATKRMNGSQVPQDKIQRILEAIRHSASSFGLQPFRVLVVEDPKLRAELQKHSYRQPQLVECSHLLLFCYFETVTTELVDSYMQNIATTRGVSLESLQGFRKNILDTISGRTLEANQIWASRQAYIALGTGLVAAALEEVDACPMEGFQPKEVDNLLQLSEQNLRSVAYLALGYRDSSKDKTESLAKVRTPSEEFFLWKRS